MAKPSFVWKTAIAAAGAALVIGAASAARAIPASSEVRAQGAAAPGGAKQVVATEGSRGRWLFNGIWRVRVLKVEPIQHPFDAGRPGIGVLVEFRNGSKKPASLSNTGVDGKPILTDTSDNTPTLDENDWQLGAYFKNLIPGQSVRHEIRFYYPAGTKANSLAPEKLILLIDPRNGLLRDTGLKYTVADPSFRIFLR